MADQQPGPKPDLVERTKDFLAELLADFVKRPVELLARRFAGRMAQFLLAITFLCVAVVFLLVALVLVLEKVGAEPYVAYLAVGVTALLLGIIVMMQKPKS